MNTVPQAIGVLGVGHLAGYLVQRLAQDPARRIVLAPRNAERAHDLAARYANVRVARDNASMAANVDLVLLATRPHQAVDAIEHLPWHPAHTLVSLCAGLPLDALMFNAGAATLARAMPITAAVIGESPTCLFPDVPAARAVLETFGPVHVLADETQFDAASVSAAFYGWLHALVNEMALWTAESGLAPATARALVGETMRAAAGMVLAQPARSLPELLDELCTPGGITELGLQTLRDGEALARWRRASEVVLEQINEQARGARGKGTSP